MFVNVVSAYFARRILSRVSIRIEENLAADVLATIKALKYKTYSSLKANFDFDQRFVLRLIQQNTRLTGIAGRNLLSAIFTVTLLTLVFTVLFFIDRRTTLVILLSIVCSSLILVTVFRLGMRHSKAFPESIPAATRARQKFIDVALSGDRVKSKHVRKNYLASNPINISLRHYEDRFKILDLGEVLVALLTAAAFIYIVTLFGNNGTEGAAPSISPFVIIAIIFIGNLLFQFLRRTSTLLIAIGRLYEQVRELWVFRVVTKSKLTNTPSTTPTPVDGHFAEYLEHVDIHDDYSNNLETGNILAVCQHTAVNRLGFFKLMNDCLRLDPAYFNYFDDTLVLEQSEFDDYWSRIKPERQAWFVNKFTNLLQSVSDGETPLPTMNSDMLLNSTSFKLFVYLKQHRGALLVPMIILKEIPPEFFKIMISEAHTKQIILMGRLPAQGLKGYEDVIPAVILNGKIAMTMETASACMLPGAELQKILTPISADVSNSKSDIEVSDAPLSAAAF